MTPTPDAARATAFRPGANLTPGGHYRWTICALLFAATTVNYVDRQVLGLLAPMLQTRIGWNELQYGYIVTAFQAAYAIGMVGMGRWIDRVGLRLGYAVALGVWSVASMAHGLARSAFGFGVARFGLGIGESGNFPAAIKTVAEWFPNKERALATGIFNSGSNIGATVAPLVVPWIAVKWGWQWAFVLTGALGAIWVVFWWAMYRPPAEHPKLSAAELAYIRSDQDAAAPEVRIPWRRLLPHRQMWAFLLGKFLTDPIWWFLLFWLPKYLATDHHLTITGIGLPLVVIYNAATVGSVVGGWLPGVFLRRGWTLNRSRKMAMLICALCVVPIVAVSDVQGLWPAVALLSLAVSAHQGWSANLFTLASDLFPEQAVASVVGVGGFGGAVGGMLIATGTGLVLQLTHSYTPVFLLSGSAYLLALLLIHLLTPRLAPARLA